MIRVAINGLGRIGRAFFRLSVSDPEIQVIAVNDRVGIKELAYLLKYDSIHGRFSNSVETTGDGLIVDDKPIRVLRNDHIKGLPWKKLDIDFVIEATGRVRTLPLARQHIKAGAKKVLITAIPKKESSRSIPMFIYGVNEKTYSGEPVISGSSCSAVCAAPVLRVLNAELAVRYGTLTAVHAYTMNQRLLDSAHSSDLRRGRAAALNIVPSASEAASVVSELVPGLEGKLMGSTIRVPTADGSLMDILCKVEKSVDASEVNEILRESAENESRSTVEYTTEPLVSRDIVNNCNSAIIDSLSTYVMQSSCVRVAAWYDHEWGYAARLMDIVKYIE